MTKTKAQLQEDNDRLEMHLGIAGYVIALELIWLFSPF